MEKKNNHPKVFISYAWSSDEYVDRVLEFAKRLISDGIDVLIDKWSLDPGADTISFMEKCVNDNSVNFVLMLLDEKYEQKANNKSGGVGIETQIISNEVYNNVEQNKFIPVVFQRNKEGKVCIPTYLKSRLYFDLSGENIESEYVGLVRHIYGVKDYTKPELGQKPSWVNDNKSVEPLKFNIMNSSSSVDFIDELFVKIMDLTIQNSKDSNDIINAYKDTLNLRNCLIEYFLKNFNESQFLDNVFDFYEKFKIWNSHNQGLKYQLWETFIHESFIYLINVLYKNRQYEMIFTILTKTYFIYNETYSSCTFFYTHENDLIDNSKKQLDNKNYHSGIAQLWLENIYEPKFTKDDFVFTDVLIFNLCTLLIKNSWVWFPITYVYNGGRFSKGPMTTFSIKLKSVYELNKIKQLFGLENIEDIKQLFIEKSDRLFKNADTYRYSGTFEKPDIILNFIDVKDIGSLR